MTHPGYWEMLKAEKWPMRLVIGVGLLIAALHGLNIAYLLFLGVTGEGWCSEVWMYSLVWMWLISAWIGRRYWRRRALAAESRSVDVTTVRPGTFSISAGEPSADLAAAVERVQRRRALATQRSAGFGR